MPSGIRDTPVDERSIRKHLAAQYLGKRFMILENCTSTNDIASRLASSETVHGLAVVSERQTRGRGRFGREWFSPYGGIWMTVVLRTETGDSLAALPVIGALAVVCALRPLAVRALLRWPNDIMVDGKKLGGVLVEAKFKGNMLAFALVGIGVNANFSFTELHVLAEKSTTLFEILGSPVDRNSVICDILLHLERLCNDVFSNTGCKALELLRESECSIGREVRVKTSDSTITGTLQGYESLTKVRIATGDQTYLSMETGSVISVEYVDG
jgi:BirA family biotin operon repressor/biotin-[acetyl-CoA-carboxylase] ligase